MNGSTAMADDGRTDDDMNTRTRTCSSQEARGFNKKPLSEVDSSVGTNKKLIVTEEGDDDGDDDDDKSLSTVLSGRSESDEESSACSSDSSLDLKQLEIEFRARDVILNELVQGIDPIYAQVMKDNEQAARRKKMKLVKEKQQRQQTSGSSREKEVNDRSETILGLWNRIRKMAACDLNNTIPGAAHLILHCLAHGSCFQVVEGFIVVLTRNFKNQDVVFISLVFGSILLLRITGGMWAYLGNDSYRRVKFDMHNRLRLRKLDARAALWFRHHVKIDNFLNLVAFYTCFLSMSYLHERFMYVFDRDLVVPVSDSLRRLTQQVLNGDTCAAEGICDLHEEAVMTERSFIWIWYYLVSAVLAIILLQVLGQSFMHR